MPRRTRGNALLALSVGALLSFGCATNTGTFLDDRITQGVLIGTVTGAAAGAAVDDGLGAIIGAVIGGVIGGVAGFIGNYTERQALELAEIRDARVERGPELVLVTLPGDLLFDVGSFALTPGAYERLDTLAATLNRYPESDVAIKGHTDSSGSGPYNLTLSRHRADSVRSYLVARGVAPQRLESRGMGEDYPLVSNATLAGRQQNRRVEFEIRPRGDYLTDSLAGVTY